MSVSMLLVLFSSLWSDLFVPFHAVRLEELGETFLPIQSQ